MCVYFISDTINFHWVNVHDSESGIALIEVLVGSSPSASDIMPAKPLYGHGTQSPATVTLPQQLDEGETVYITLKVWNNAGTLF